MRKACRRILQGMEVTLILLIALGCSGGGPTAPDTGGQGGPALTSADSRTEPGLNRFQTTGFDEDSGQLESRVPAPDDVTLIVVLSGAPPNLYVEAREQADRQFPEINAIADRIKSVYRSAGAPAFSTAVRAQVAPLVRQLEELREARAEYVTSLLQSVLDPIQSEAAARISLVPDTVVTHRDLILNSLTVKTRRSHLSEIASLPGVREVVEDIEAVPMIDTTAQGLKLRPGAYPDTLWGLGYHGEGFDVLGIDSGVYTSHSAFSGLNIISQYFPTGASGCTSGDTVNHGTSVCGTIASQNTTYRGMSYGIETYYNGKICDGYDGFSAMQEAYSWAGLGGSGYKDAEVVNFSMSFVFDCFDTTGLDIVSSYLDATIDLYGVVWSVSAGNRTQGCSTDYIRDKPAVGYNMFSVGGVTNNDTGTRNDDAYYTTTKYGPVTGVDGSEQRLKPDVLAPTGGRAPTNTGGWGDFWGTSGSAPHFSGVAAVLFDAGVPNSLEMRALNFATAEDITNPGGVGPDNYAGFGYVDAWNAYSHIAHTYTSTLSKSGDGDLYRIANVQPGNRVVLVYDKRGTYNSWYLSNFDLKIYDESTSSLLHQTTKLYENKEYWQFSSSDTGKNVIVAAVLTTLPSALGSDTYAISANTTLTKVDKPALKVTINTPASISQYDVVKVTVDVQNTGTIAVQDVSVDLTLPSGWQLVEGTDPQQVGSIGPSETRSVSVTAFVPDSGAQQISAAAYGTTYGLPISGSKSLPLNIAASSLLTLPAQVEEQKTFTVEAGYTNHSSGTYSGLSLKVNYESSKVQLETGANPSNEGEIYPGGTAAQSWQFKAVSPGTTSLSLTVSYTFNGTPVSFTTPGSTLTITPKYVDPYAPVLVSPSDGYQFVLGTYLTLSWKKGPSGNPSSYWLDVWVDGYHSTLVPVGGINLGNATSLVLPSSFVETNARDGTWEWAVAAMVGGVKHWSVRRKIIKSTAPVLITPQTGAKVGVNQVFQWTAEPGANNYVARVTGILPGGTPYYLPLNTTSTQFVLSTPYYSMLKSGIVYTWAIAATALGSALSDTDQVTLSKLSYSESRSFVLK